MSSDFEQALCRAIADMVGNDPDFISAMVEDQYIPDLGADDYLEGYEEDDEHYEDEEFPQVTQTSTFEDRGMMTMNSGFCVKLSDGREYTFECVRYR